MGLNSLSWKFLKKYLPLLGDPHGKEMLELGCQEIKNSAKKIIKWNKSGIAKKYFKHLGFKHISIDRNGKFGSLKYDLRHELPEKFHNRFDITTNFGTSEHVNPRKTQYTVFRNIHICTKKDGLFVHVLPGPRSYLGHCQAYYPLDFFKVLADLNNYEIVSLSVVRKPKRNITVAACLRKLADNDFTSDNDKLLDEIIWVKKQLYLKHQKNKSKYLV